MSILLFSKSLIRDGSIDLVINIASQVTQHPEENYLIRRNAIDSNVPLMTNLQVGNHFIRILYYIVRYISILTLLYDCFELVDRENIC